MTRLEWIVVLMIGALGIGRMLRANRRDAEVVPELIAELEANPDVSAAERQDLIEGIRSASRQHLVDGFLFLALAVITALSFVGAV